VFTWVYKYRYWDEDRQENAMSEEAFTMDAIRSGLGVPVVESGQKVRTQDIDDSGRFRRYVPSPAEKQG
jgi:hypothetical protein